MKIDRHLSLMLLKRGNKICLGIKKRGFGIGKLTEPGGKVEPNETYLEAAIRETSEEVGIQVREAREVGKIIYHELHYKGEPETDMTHVFLSEDFSGEPTKTDELEPKWYDVDALPFDKMWQDAQFWMPLVLENKEIEAYFHYNSDNTFDEYWVDEVPNKQIGPLIDDELVGLGKKKVQKSKLKNFYGARAVLQNEKGQFALIHATKRGWYKLPGGGHEADELWGENLRRELIEETGFKVKDVTPLGYVINIRADWNMHAIAYMYLCKTAEFVSKNQMDDEIEDGDQLEWFDSFDDAIAVLEAVDLKKIDFYGAYFFTRREIEALKYAKQVYKELYG